MAIDDAHRRLPPQNLEAEEAVLGGILLDNAALDRAAEFVQTDDFYRESHRKIFRAMHDLSARNEPADLITLSEALKARGELADVGGSAYLAELAERVPTAAHVVQYAKIVRDKSILRALIGAATEIAMKGYEAGDDVGDMLDRAEQLVFNISDRKVKPQFVRISDVLVDSLKTIEKLYEQKQAVTGVSTGYHDLDALTAGLQPSDLIIIAGRPSMGKCLAADSEIVLADGSVRRIADVVRAGEAELLTLADSWRLESTRPSAFVDDGMKPTFAVTTRLGRRVRTTLPHPFLTIDGWKPLAELRPGDRVAVPRRLPVAGSESIGMERAALLGYLLGDGTLTGPCPRFTHANARLRDDFTAAAESLGVAGREEGGVGRAPTLRVPAAVTAWCQGRGAPGTAGFDRACTALDVAPEVHYVDVPESARDALRRWIAELGLADRTARDKFVPEIVFRLRLEEVACFLNRLFATDGWATVPTSGQAQLGFGSVSERLCRQTQHLLLRFGVVAAVAQRRMRHRDELRTAWRLEITDAESIRTFIERIGMFGREAALQRVARALAAKRHRTNRDTVPIGIWRQIDAARRGRPWSTIAERMGLTDAADLHVGTRAPSRRRLAAIADALDDPALSRLAESDVYWDAIVSIEPAGLDHVYDLTVPGSHNFVADDVCVHNTAFSLNIAEHAALRTDTGVAIFSLEMSKEQLALRMLCSESRVDLKRVRTGHLSDREFPKLAMAAGRLADAPIFIDDTPALTVLELRAKARRLKRDASSKLGLVIVDYLQLMRSSEGKDSREQEISEISRSLKALAKELHLPVIALSQLNRQVENRNPPKPRLADLRESGAIEQDADVIAFIYRDEVYNEDTDKRGIAEIIVAKQRNGPVDSVELTFLAEFTRFENRELAPEEVVA